MRRLLTLLAPLAFGLFLGKYFGEVIQPTTAFGPLPQKSLPAMTTATGNRGPASVAPALQEKIELANAHPDSAPEAALALFSRMSASNIRTVCETARELYATKAITSYAKYIRDFSNFKVHLQYLEAHAKSLQKEATAWRGTGRLIAGDSPIDIEVLVSPPKANLKLEESNAADECYTVQLFASRDGGLRQVETGTHCMSDLAYREGQYYFTWAGASGSLYHLDISAILISLPKSKSGEMAFMADGRDEWQSAESFSWSPVSDEEQSVRLARLLSELDLINQ